MNKNRNFKECLNRFKGLNSKEVFDMYAEGVPNIPDDTKIPFMKSEKVWENQVVNEKVPDIPDDTKIPFMKSEKVWENQVVNEEVPDIPDDTKIPFMKSEKVWENQVVNKELSNISDDARISLRINVNEDHTKEIKRKNNIAINNTIDSSISNKSNKIKNLLYETEQYILENVRLIRDECDELYYFEDVYIHAIPRKWNAFIKKLLPAEMRRQVRAPNFYDNLLRDLQTDPDIKEIDKDICQIETKYKIAFQNGVYDVETDSFSYGFSESDYIFSKLDVKYVENPNPYDFFTFLNEVCRGDSEKSDMIWQMIAYIVIPANDGKCFFVLGTAPNSGKSLLMDVLSAIFPKNEVNRQDMSKLTGRFGLASMAGKRLNLCGEISRGKIKDDTVNNIKILTGEHEVNIERKGIDSTKESINCKLIFATNNSVCPDAGDDAFFNRMRIVPFEYSISKSQQDPNLKWRLIQCKDEIVSYAVKNYARELVASNYDFAEPVAAIAMKNIWQGQYKTDIDFFMDDMLEITNNMDDFIPSSQLFDMYKNWANENGYEATKVAQNGFSRAIRSKIDCSQESEKASVEGKSVRVIRGIREKSDD